MDHATAGSRADGTRAAGNRPAGIRPRDAGWRASEGLGRKGVQREGGAGWWGVASIARGGYRLNDAVPRLA
jgi:hypothetical protein